MLLRDMVEDPLTGLLVDPAWAEPPLMRPPEDLNDGIALERPAPDLDQIGTVVYLANAFDLSTGDVPRSLAMFYEVGVPTIQVT
jgi:hypothetical protein